ncbi:MAG: hypothetical protein ACJ72W_03050 [Actinoallomurus sp.]
MVLVDTSPGRYRYPAASSMLHGLVVADPLAGHVLVIIPAGMIRRLLSDELPFFALLILIHCRRAMSS